MPDPSPPPQDDLAQRCREAANDWRLNVMPRALLLVAADELSRLKAVEQEHRELVAAVDANVRESVWKHGQDWAHGENGFWLTRATGGQGFPTRAEAEAAYRQRTGLDTSGKGEEL